MTTGIADLLHSERGVFALLLLFCITVLVVLGKLDGATWVEFAKYLAAALLASKTVTTAVETYALKKPQIDRPEEAKPS